MKYELGGDDRAACGERMFEALAGPLREAGQRFGRRPLSDWVTPCCKRVAPIVRPGGGER